MCVHGSLIVLLSVAGTVVLGLALASPDTPAGAVEPERPRIVVPELVSPRRRTSVEPSESESGDTVVTRSRRRTKDSDEQTNIESSISLWEWLKGRDKPEDNCMLMAIGGVASGGFLTGAFVGAGIGSIFTGPGAIVGGIVGGLVGVFGGLSVGARAGAVACENV
ncbi:uncharacterized protein LOC131288599 [Anopheles ziemanni]|uniref:uncharacterized protein LOC131259021 n=1 Tax=Anopheles coustani TaxID=139045 RepID=UPI002659863E|nr:uncharacterized protein LOC131259021 [Anopheles coustani]XP_058173730.1 uncharacterized protein LOC131288599 [Anopheles ziemanni]